MDTLPQALQWSAVQSVEDEACLVATGSDRAVNCDRAIKFEINTARRKRVKSSMDTIDEARKSLEVSIDGREEVADHGWKGI